MCLPDLRFPIVCPSSHPHFGHWNLIVCASTSDIYRHSSIAIPAVVVIFGHRGHVADLGATSLRRGATPIPAVNSGCLQKAPGI
jgi:hypothetical protein